MSSSDAQRSPVHHATEDSGAEPTGPAGPAKGGDRGTPEVDARHAAEMKARPDDAMGVPGNFESGAAMAGRRPDTDEDANPPGAANVIGGGPGAGDASSGGGAGAGIPGGGTDLRTGGAFNSGNVEEDRQHLFPNAPAPRRPGADDKVIGKDPDESSYGGPLNLDDPDAV